MLYHTFTALLQTGQTPPQRTLTFAHIDTPLRDPANRRSAPEMLPIPLGWAFGATATRHCIFSRLRWVPSPKRLPTTPFCGRGEMVELSSFAPFFSCSPPPSPRVQFLTRFMPAAAFYAGVTTSSPKTETVGAVYALVCLCFILIQSAEKRHEAHITPICIDGYPHV